MLCLLLRSLVDEAESLYTAFDPTAVRALWRNRLITLGRQVKATSGDTVIEGTAIDVAGDGALIIRQNDGTECTVVAGDVTLRHVAGNRINPGSGYSAPCPYFSLRKPFMNMLIRSIGMGKTIVEFFSEAISVSVCK